MWRSVAVCLSLCLSLLAPAGPVRARADEKAGDRADERADELARLAGEYTAVSSIRTGQVPAEKEALKDLTLKVTDDQWVQSFRGDIAPYTIMLDLTDDVRAIKLTHRKVKAERNGTYLLQGDTLTVTEDLGPDVGLNVTVWKRKLPIN